MANIWLLNPDAELELSKSAPGKKGAYTPSAASRAAMNERRASFDELTLGEKSLLAHELDEWAHEERSREAAFFLWCPTPSLRDSCKRLGLRVPASPEWSLLTAVNDKTRLGEWGLSVLPERRLLRRVDELKEPLERHDVLRLKRPFGFAGRGQRRITASLSPDDLRWVSASLRNGPLVVEPELSSIRLRSVHLMIDKREVIVGTPVGFQCDEFGAFRGWDREGDPERLTQSLRSLARASGENLLNAGYFGPAGIDFAVEESGAIHALDLNGRFSLAWSRGMGAERARALLLHQSQR